MRDALIGVLTAAVVALAHMAAFSYPYSLPRFVFLLAVWTVPLQTALIIRNLIHNHRLKPENQPTSQLQDVPETRPFNKP